jgi:hypothetical protein
MAELAFNTTTPAVKASLVAAASAVSRDFDPIEDNGPDATDMAYPGCKNTYRLDEIPDVSVDIENGTKHWPFAPGTRVVTKGRGKQTLEIQLEHATKQFTYGEHRASTPHGILTAMADAGIIARNTGNWARIWVTANGGRTYALGRDLRRFLKRRQGGMLFATARVDV